ncbi:MAG: T6SS effector amidase Tae4 family protein [Planctomycetota bacterium]
MGREYDTGGAGRCAVKVSKALKAAGLSFTSYSFKWLWKNDLPVNATELSKFLKFKFGAGETVNRRSPGMNVRQGILFIAGGWASPHGQPVGHITLWNGQKCEDGTSHDVQKGAPSCLFWELRPDWLKG